MSIFRRLHLVLALIACARLDAAGPPPKSEEKLQTRAMRMMAAIPIPEAVPMPPTPDGEPRFDVLKFLGANGVETPAGAEAIWLSNSNVIVATLLPKDHDLMGRILEVPCLSVRSKTIQLTLSVWDYEDGRSAANNQPTTFKEIEERAGDTLRLLHSQTLQTRSGNRVVGISRQGGASLSDKRVATPSPAAKPDDPLPPLGATRGSVVRFEPVTGPDGISIDVRTEYELRVPSSHAGIDVEGSGDNILTVMADSEIVVQNAAIRVPDEKIKDSKVRRYAVVLGGALKQSQEEIKASIEERLSEDALEKLRWEKEIIQRAKAK